MTAVQTNSAGRILLGECDPILPLPNFISAQRESFDSFLKKGLNILFEEINPVKDTLGRMWTLEFGDVEYGKPNRSPQDAIQKNLSYDAPVYIKVKLTNEKSGEIKEQKIFVADFPLMTPQGTFVFNGITKIVVHQIVRAEGVLFEESKASTPMKRLFSARLMPSRGQWFEFDVSKHNVITVRLVNNRPKILMTSLLRVLGFPTDDDIRAAFKDVMGMENDLIEATLAKDSTDSREKAIVDIYNKIRPDESVTLDSAEKYIKGFFFNDRRFDLGRIGRHMLNKKLGLKIEMKPENFHLYTEDLVEILKSLVLIHNGKRQPDDVDHLANRRIRSVGEIIVDEIRIGVRRMEKTIRDRMAMHAEDEKITPSVLISTKPVSAAINSLFGTGQLCRYMDQENFLAELEQKRQITAVGPGGLTKERATFSVRDVHHSHYSRICPIQTPEGQSVGVSLHLALYSRINEYGFIEAPYRKVHNKVKNNQKSLLHRIPTEDVKDPKSKKVVAKAGHIITEEIAQKIAKLSAIKELDVKPFVTDEIEYVAPYDEDNVVVGMSTIESDEYGNYTGDLVSVRTEGHFFLRPPSEIRLVDITPSQMQSVSLSTIPFVQNDDPHRSMMASNTQKQAVPLVVTDSAISGTGYETAVARQSGWAYFAEKDGEVTYVDGDLVRVKYKGERQTRDYNIVTFQSTNQDHCYTQIPRVDVGQKVHEGDVLVDGPSMENGEMALGKNLLTAYMVMDGYVYEDGFLISERLVKDDVLTSVHIKRFDHELRETDLGPELLTNDIPNVSERALRNLDETGIVRTGARVRPGDVLVGTIAPKGEQELTSEERLLRAIFGEHARDVRDNSLKVPNGQGGVVIKVEQLSVEKGDKLPAGVISQIKVWVAQTMKISHGDKLTGRHGDKGSISEIFPVEDMPFLEDGTPVDIIINPLAIKRMNIGHLLESRYAKIAQRLGIKLAFPNFERHNVDWLLDEATSKGIDTDERSTLVDGRTGRKYPVKVKNGPKYFLKLKHISVSKIHARSTGPYTLVTQQPLGGKAQMGGQRFGEMEVWALEAHGVPAILQEMLTIKSDDVKGRADAYKAIIHGEKIETVTTPESFKVLMRELNALCLNLDLIYDEVAEDVEAEKPEQSSEQEAK